MLISRIIGSGSNILRCKVLDSTSTTGAGLTGLTSASAGLRISTMAATEATPTAYTQAGSTIEAVTTLGTFLAPTATKCRFKEVDATNHPGVYELQIADARFAIAGQLLVSLSGATSMVQTDFIVDQAFAGIDPAYAGAVLVNGILDMGTAQSVTSTTVVLRSAAAFSDNALSGATIVVYGSTQGYAQVRQIISNVGSTDTVTVDVFGVTPTGTITYQVLATSPGSVTTPPGVNILKVNGTTVNGLGTLSQPWGP